MQILKLLLKGVHVDGPDDEDMTPLMTAVTAKQAAAVSVLLKAGANVHALDVHGRTALSYVRTSLWLLMCAGCNKSRPGNGGDARGVRFRPELQRS